MPRCRSKIMQGTNSYSTNCPLSTALLARITLSTQRLASFLIHSPLNSPHIFTSYQTSGTQAPKRTKEISCFTCLNLLIQNRFFFFNNNLRVIIVRYMYITNNISPNIDPCGTPHLMFSLCDFILKNFMHCVLSDTQLANLGNSSDT